MIPSKLINFMCYNEGEVMVGVADVTLPNLAYVTAEIQGAGIAGSVDSPVVGHFQSMTTAINWRTLIEQNIAHSAPNTHHFDFRGSAQAYDENSGEYLTRSVKVVLRVQPKSLNLGTFNPAAPMGTSGEFEVIYIKVSIEGREWLEIDKFAFICRIAGVDYLSKVRQDMGLA